MIGRVAALEALHDRLAHLRDQVELGRNTENFNVDAPEVQRTVMVEALAAAAELLENLGWAKDRLGDPFVRMLIGLENLQQGVKDPVLSPAHLDSRPPLAGTLMSMRGRAAAVMGKLMKLGLSEEEAAKAVFRGLKPKSVEILSGASKNPPNWKNIKRWRDETSASPADSPSQAGFRAMLAIIESRQLLSNPDCRDTDAKQLLRGLAKQIQAPIVAAQNLKKVRS